MGPRQSGGLGDHHWEGPTKASGLCRAPVENVDGVQKLRMAMMEERCDDGFVGARVVRGGIGATAFWRELHIHRRHSL